MANVLVCADAMFHPSGGNDCDNCAAWQLRHEVAVRATYYLALYIGEVYLRMAVLEEITVSWALCVHDGAGSEGFQRFFAGYCADVEGGVNPAKRNTAEHSTEYRRVWTDHARRLHEANLVTLGEIARIN